MKTFSTISLAVMLATFVAAPASANVMWDGSGSLIDKGYVLHGNALFSWDTESGVPHVGTAYQNTTIGEASGGYSLDGTTAAAELDNDVGWKVEWDVQVLQNYSVSPYGSFGVCIVAEDQVGGVGATLRTDRVNWYGAGFESFNITGPNYGAVITTMVDMTSGYHKLAVTVAANATVGHVWIDDVDQGSVTLTANLGEPDLLFGDGGTGEYGEANWDYVNVIPEPSTLVLLGIGAISLLAYIWRWRRRTA